MSVEKLPEGWVKTSIEAISVKCVQRTPNELEEFIYVDIGSINRDLKMIESPQYLLGQDAPSRARKAIKAGDIIVSLTRPNLNAVALVSEKYDGQIASTGFEVIRPYLIESRYIFALVRSRHFIDSISGLVQGALYPAAKSSDVQSYEFPLPSFAEQKIIAEKLDTLLVQVDITKARLEKIPQILKRFRQAVLTAAMNGKLTEKWCQTRGLRQPYTIKIHELVESSFYGPRFSKNDYTADTHGIPTIRTTDMDKGGITITSETPRVLVPVEKINQFKVQRNDLLITRTGSIGVMALFFDDYIAIPSAYLIRFRFKKNINAKYIFFALTSPEGQRKMGLSTTAITQPNINANSIKNIDIFYPDIEEQHEIVRRVEQLFAYADTIEKQVNTALSRVNHLTQSILAKAFRGELTAQWREENPDLISGENSAAALLEKIKAERAASGGKKASRKKA